MSEIAKKWPAPAPIQLPHIVAANDNVERRAVEVAAKRWGTKVAIQTTEKSVLRGLFAWLGAAVANPALGAAAAVSDICPGDTPIREPDENTQTPPVIDRPPFGKTIDQWIDEMEEASRIAIDIANKQAEIQRHQSNGQAHLARRAQQDLDQLLAYAQTIQNSTSATITSGALTMVASAGGAAATSTTGSTALSDENRKYLDDIRHEATGSPHLSMQERTELLRAIDDALSGKRSVVDITARVYELRRDITAHNGRRDPLLSSVQTGINSALRRNTPDHPGFDFDYGTPSFDQLLANANFDLNDIIFTTQPSLRDDINALHKMGKSIWLISLADGIQSEHIDALTDGNTYALHDYFHLLEWFSVPLPVRQYAATLYTLISPIVEAHRIAGRFDLYLDRLVELGETYQLMKLVVKFPVHIIDGLLADRHPVIPAIYHALQNHIWSGPHATQQRDATTQALIALQIGAYAPTAQTIADIFVKHPPATGPFGMGYTYDLPYVASGETRYPRLEALVAQLLADKASPQIVERGAGEFAALSVTLARLYPSITVIERLKDVRPNFDGIPPKLRDRIRLLDINNTPTLPFADLAIWIHPIPFIMTERDALTLNLSLLGQDVVDSGYLVVQTEVNYVVPQSPGWKLIYGGHNMGYLAPSRFANASAHTIVLQKIPQKTPDDWLTLLEADPNTFVQRAYEKIEILKTALSARLARGEAASAIKFWYQRDVLPEISIINGLVKTRIPQELQYSVFRTLSHALEFWCTIIPMHLELGDIDLLKAFTDSLLK